MKDAQPTDHTKGTNWAKRQGTWKSAKQDVTESGPDISQSFDHEMGPRGEVELAGTAQASRDDIPMPN